MLIILENILTADEVKQFRQHLSKAEWQSGSATAGSVAQQVKRNQQLDDHSEIAISLGNHILKKLGHNPSFISAALPDKIYPPKFNRYADNETYGAHIDSALMQLPEMNQMLRTDLSATLFLCDPDEYDGGELSIETHYGIQNVKLPSGSLVLYPSTSLHQVTPVSRGERLASFFWIQSLVSNSQQRQTLHELDQSVQALTADLGETHAQVVRLSGIYHNLVRQWAQPS